jgi:hypothetical protein
MNSFDVAPAVGSGFSIYDFWPIIVILLVAGLAFLFARKIFMD